jgi:hypothetical protein
MRPKSIIAVREVADKQRSGLVNSVLTKEVARVWSYNEFILQYKQVKLNIDKELNPTKKPHIHGGVHLCARKHVHGRFSNLQNKRPGGVCIGIDK